MARTGGAKNFWEVLKSVSVAEIAREANRPLSVAVIGEAEARRKTVQALLSAPDTAKGETQSQALALPGAPVLKEFATTREQDGFPPQSNVFDIIIDVGEGRHETPEGAAIYSLEELGGWESTLDRILEDRPELALPLARNFPVFRKRVAQGIIAQTAVANAQFSLLTGISAALPITAIILPVNSLSDILVLTKNQAMMTLRLAAVYGLPVDYKSRMKEIAPLLGNAFGWRAIARELVGIVPGVGFLVRAMISYAGTVTVGKAAQIYYETGEQITSAQARKLYKEAYEASREKVRSLAKGGRGKRSDLPRQAQKAEVPQILPHPIQAEPLEEEEAIEGVLLPSTDETPEEGVNFVTAENQKEGESV